jgi:hypothetical protein
MKVIAFIFLFISPYSFASGTYLLPPSFPSELTEDQEEKKEDEEKKSENSEEKKKNGEKEGPTKNAENEKEE